MTAPLTTIEDQRKAYQRGIQTLGTLDAAGEIVLLPNQQQPSPEDRDKKHRAYYHLNLRCPCRFPQSIPKTIFNLFR